MADDEAVHVEIDPNEFGKVLRDLKAFDKTLSTSVRKQIRVAGKILQDAAAAEIRAYPAAKYDKGMREQLANSLAVRINNTAGSSRQGVSVVSTGRLLPANKRALVKAMNRKQFRHPVFGGDSRKVSEKLTTSWKQLRADRHKPHNWVNQQGMRYFRQDIATAHEGEIRRLISLALDEAARSLQ